MNITEIIKQPEGRKLEFKEKLPENSDLARTVIAFANDAGGDVFIGVADSPRIIVGVNDNELHRVEEKINSIIFDRCYPMVLPRIKSIAVEGKNLIQITVFPGSTPPYYLKEKGLLDGTYIRVGSTNRLADQSIIAELERKKHNVSFDSELVFEKQATELNITTLKALFVEKTGEELTEQVLKKLELMKELHGVYYPTNALVLFSDDDIRNSIFHFAKIECGVFKGVSKDEFIDQKSIISTIATQAETAYTFLLRHINEAAWVEGVYTLKRWEYPVKAIREIIRNAVVHRDYSLTGKDVKLAIYEDMIEITSPGLLPPSINYADMELRQSDVRNKTLAPIFKHIGIIDQWGNGLTLISNEMKNYPEIELKWREVGLSFQVQFIKKNFIFDKDNTTNSQNEGVNLQNKGVNLQNEGVNLQNEGVNLQNEGVNNNNLKERIISIILSEAGLNVFQLMEKLEKSKSTIERYIRELKDENKIEFKGAPKTGGYYIIQNEEK